MTEQQGIPPARKRDESPKSPETDGRRSSLHRCIKSRFAPRRAPGPRHRPRSLRPPVTSCHGPSYEALISRERYVKCRLRANYPKAETIHLVMDNFSTHRRTALVERFGGNIGGLLWDRFTVDYTPTHGSWLNQAEIEISLFARQCLGRRRIPSLPQLQREALAWNRKMNHDRVTINWKFTRSKARQKFGYKRNKITRSQTWHATL